MSSRGGYQSHKEIRRDVYAVPIEEERDCRTAAGLIQFAANPGLS